MTSELPNLEQQLLTIGFLQITKGEKQTRPRLKIKNGNILITSRKNCAPYVQKQPRRGDLQNGCSASVFKIIEKYM